MYANGLLCSHCGNAINKDEEYHVINGIVTCKHCYLASYFKCENCGRVMLIWHSVTVYTHSPRPEVWCNDCAKNTYKCYSCGSLYLSSNDGHFDEYGKYMCCDCISDYFVCAGCGHWISNEYGQEINGEYYCQNCYPEDYCINNYDYKPEPIFYGEGPLYLGVELEIDDGGEYSDNASKILDIGNCNKEYIYIKHDGSLRNGFEIVSYPCTLDVHMFHVPWKEILKKADCLGYRSHDAGTCGLHVHISRSALGETPEEKDLTITKILCIFEKFWDELVYFSRRSNKELNQWASRYGIRNGIYNTPKELLDIAKFCGNRYHAVNLEPHDTIEIRIFRGTLNYNTFIASLQLCKLLVDVSLKYDILKIHDITWDKFIELGGEYKELQSYCKRLKESQSYYIEHEHAC